MLLNTDVIIGCYNELHFVDHKPNAVSVSLPTHTIFRLGHTLSTARFNAF
jgi:hypothetical protein